MVHCIIIDDEVNCIEMLEWLLKTYCPDVVINAMCDSGEKGIEAINKFKPDVVFLDIEMPVLNGFDLLNKILHLNFSVVFITAYNKYALKAFRFNALDYLVKPIDTADLVEAVAKAEARASE